MFLKPARPSPSSLLRTEDCSLSILLRIATNNHQRLTDHQPPDLRPSRPPVSTALQVHTTTKPLLYLLLRRLSHATQTGPTPCILFLHWVLTAENSVAGTSVMPTHRADPPLESGQPQTPINHPPVSASIGLHQPRSSQPVCQFASQSVNQSTSLPVSRTMESLFHAKTLSVFPSS
jgi:hypothetical protein